MATGKTYGTTEGGFGAAESSGASAPGSVPVEEGGSDELEALKDDLQSLGRRVTELASAVLDAGRDQLAGAARRVAGGTSSAAGYVKDRARSGAEAVSEGVEYAAEKTWEGLACGAESLRQTVDEAGRQAKRTVAATESQIRFRPLMSLGVAFGVGLVIGKLIDAGAASSRRRWR